MLDAPSISIQYALGISDVKPMKWSAYDAHTHTHTRASTSSFSIHRDRTYERMNRQKLTARVFFFSLTMFYDQFFQRIVGTIRIAAASLTVKRACTLYTPKQCIWLIK